MIRQEHPLLVQLLHCFKKLTQIVGAIDVGHAVTELLHDLRQRRCCHTVLAATEVNQNKRGITQVGSQLRRESGTDIGNGCKCRHNQRHR